MGLGYRDILSDQWIAYEATGVRHAVLVAAMAGALLWLAFRAVSARVRAMALAGLPILCAADLLIWGAGFNPATDPAMLTGEPEVVRTLRSAWPGRALSLETPELGIKSLIVPNFNAVAGYREVQGADSVHTLRYHLALSAAAEHMSSLWRAFPEPNTVRLPGADHPLLDALNVRYVTTAPPAVLPAERFHRVEDAELTVWRNPRACGDAWIVNRVISVAGPTEAVERLEAPPFDVHAAATVEGPPPQLHARAVGSARLTAFSAHRATYDVQTTGPALLVMSEPAYPGWRATVQIGTERETAILVADGVLRAIVVPAGRSRVVMAYEPASYRVGLYLTCLGLASVAWILAATLVLRKRSPNGDHPSGG